MGETGWKGFIAPLGGLGVLPKAIGAPNGHTYDRAKPWTKRRLKIPASGGKGKSDEKAPTAPILVSKLIAVYTHFDVCDLWNGWVTRRDIYIATFARVGNYTSLLSILWSLAFFIRSKKTQAPLWNAEVNQMSAIAAPSEEILDAL
jgi:hypothetical protein